MELTVWHLVVGWFIVYSIVSVVINRVRPPGERVTLHGPLTLVHSKAGLATIDRIALLSPRLWSVWGKVGLVTFLTGMVGVVFVMGFSVFRVVSEPSAVALAKDPQNLVVIPGVNPFLPLAAAPEIVGALLIAMVVHELGHAIYCRLGGIAIDSTGLVFLGLIPSGAFVEPDEESLETASVVSKLKMVSAGVMNNIALAGVCLVALVVIVPFVLTPASGAALGGVLPDSPAAHAGLESGSLVVGVDGESVDSFSEFATAINNSTAEAVVVQTSSGETYTVQRFVFVTGAVESSVLSPTDTITAVDGTPVHTQKDIIRLAEQADDPFVFLTTTQSSEPVKFTTGARIRLAGVDDAQPVTVTHVEGNRVHTASAFSQAIDADSETPVTLTVVSTEDAFESADVEYTPAEQTVALTPGLNGVTVSDFGVQKYPAEQYLGFITATGQSIGATVLLIMFLPFGTFGGLPYNFAGFTPDVISFYTVTPLLDPIAGLVFAGVSLLFWSVWINLNLALFNMLPTFALDGGHYLKNGLIWIAEGRGVREGEQRTARLYKGLALVMLAALAAVIVVPIVFG
jgi:membrane-associated protease RseP (regulator of RpoE activity)